MGKGLKRSLALGGTAQNHTVLKQTVRVNEALEFTGSTGVAVDQTAVLEAGFPEGNIYVLGLMAQLAFDVSAGSANISDTWSGDIAIGTVATADNDITTPATNDDVLTSTTTGVASSEAIAATDFSNVTPFILDVTAGAVALNLNMIVDADDVTNATAATITVIGDLTILYTVMSDD